jgi:uncharacterized caspase-like protein
MANTIKKRLEREAFVHRHHKTFAALIKDARYVPASGSTEILDFVTDVARPALKYAPGSDADSIWFTLQRAYRKLYQTPGNGQS